jgi:hypothetical protein
MLIALLLMLFMPVIQQEPPKEPKPPKRGDVVVAKGCLRGGVLESADVSTPNVENQVSLITFRLTGDKKALQEIKKDHDGHADVITGELRTDLPTSTETRGKKIGNTRITIGVGTNRGMNGDPVPPPMPVLKVTSLEHTGVTCR